MKYAGLVWKNLARNKRRTILTILSIAVSLFIFAVLVSMPSLANQVLAAQSSSLRVVCHNKAGLTYPMPEAHERRIAAAPHVAAIVAQSWFGGIYHEPTDQFPNFAVEHQQIDQVWPDWGIAPNAVRAFKGERTAALVSVTIMRRFGWRVGQQVMLRGTIYPVNVTLHIVGTLGDKAPPFLLFRRDYLDELIGRTGWVNAFWIKVDRAESVAPVIAEIDETFANSDAETQSESEASFFGSFIAQSRSLFALMEVLGLIVIATIALVAANTAAMSVRERRAEIAVLRSMGFSSRAILSLLLSESILIGVAGGALGCGVGYLALRWFMPALPGVVPFGVMRMPASVLAESLLIAVLIGWLSGFFPARSAARANIVDALRTVA